MSAHALSVVLIGGPGCGKTSYLGALWSTVRDAALDAPVHLRGTLPQRTQYLDAAEHALLACEPVERTKGGTAERVTLDLSVDRHDIDLEYLDLAGESVEAGLKLRMVGEEFAAHLQGASCLVLFVHPNPTIQQTITDANRGLRAIDPVLASQSDTEGADADAGLGELDPLVVWLATPTSVQLVDLLQVAEGLRGDTPCHIAVVVSAWDTVANSPDGTLTPSQWLEGRLPLLHQFLSANEAQNRWNVYGISAQGGDFQNDEDVERLLDLTCPERTIVESDAGRSTDISEPLRWFVEGLM